MYSQIYHIKVFFPLTNWFVGQTVPTRMLGAGLIMFTIFVLSAQLLASPVYFSLDAASPSVGGILTEADIFDPVFLGPGPPPSGICQSRAALGLVAGDEVDAVSNAHFFMQDMGAVLYGEDWAANYFFWSVDRASVGSAAGGDILAAVLGPVGTGVASPVFDETTVRLVGTCFCSVLQARRRHKYYVRTS